MFADQYLDKEENSLLLGIFMKLLLTNEIVLDMIDAQEPDIADYHTVPEVSKAAVSVKSCLQDSEELPKDFTKLFDLDLFEFDTKMLQEAIQLYDKLKLPHEPLSLINPQFEAPMPPLVPAVLPPALRDLPPPPLELFDIDEHFASEATKLAQLTNKCSDEDLDFYIMECAEILGIKKTDETWDSNKVLGHVFASIVKWKLIDPN